MASVKKGQLTRAPVLNVHLRPKYKRLFWKGERLGEKRDTFRQVSEANA